MRSGQGDVTGTCRCAEMCVVMICARGKGNSQEERGIGGGGSWVLSQQQRSTNNFTATIARIQTPLREAEPLGRRFYQHNGSLQ